MRSFITTKPVAENLDPIIEQKRKENIYYYYLKNEFGSLTRVCLSFFSKLLQISRSKVFRAIKSSVKNPAAVDRRGSARNRQTHYSDLKYLRDFIDKFVSYEAHNSTHSVTLNKQFLHPRVNLRKIYQLYSEDCAFKQKKNNIGNSF